METIFSNLESLYEFQLDFLHQLEARVSPDHMEDSQIGEVFVMCVSTTFSQMWSADVCVSAVHEMARDC